MPPCCLTWGQTMVEIMKIMAPSFRRSHAQTSTLSASKPAAGLHWPTPLPETPGHSWASLGQSHLGSLCISPGSWCAQICLCLPRVCFPDLCKFWWLCGGVNDDLLQEEYGLCHTQVCCTQSPCLCSSPLPTHTSIRDTQTQFCLSLCGVSGSWYTQGLFEPSEYLWLVWGFDSKCNFIPPTIFLGFLLCP